MTMSMRFIRNGSVVAIAIGMYSEGHCEAAGMARLKSFFPPNAEHVISYSTHYSGVFDHQCSSGKCWVNTQCATTSKELPTPGTDLLAYYNGYDDTNHVIYESVSANDSNRADIIDLFWHGSTSGCSSSSTTVILTGPNGLTGAPAPFASSGGDGSYLFSTLAGFTDSSNISHVFYVDSSQLLHEMYRHQGRWFQGNPPGFGNAIVNGANMSAVWDGSTEHVFVRGYDANTWDISLTSGASGWLATRLTGSGGAITPNLDSSTAPSNFITATLTMSDAFVWGPAADGSLMRGIGLVSGGWQAFSATPPNLSTNSPTAALFPNGPVYFVGTNQHVYEDSGTDMTATYGMPSSEMTAGGYGPITAGNDSGFNGHIFWIGTDEHVHEYYQGCGGWCGNTPDGSDVFP